MTRAEDLDAEMLVRFDDFARQSYRSNVSVGLGRFFVAVNDPTAAASFTSSSGSYLFVSTIR